MMRQYVFTDLYIYDLTDDHLFIPGTHLILRALIQPR